MEDVMGTPYYVEGSKGAIIYVDDVCNCSVVDYVPFLPSRRFNLLFPRWWEHKTFSPWHGMMRTFLHNFRLVGYKRRFDLL